MRTRRIATALAVAVLLLLTFLYHAAAALVGFPPSRGTEMVYNAAVIACYILIYFLLSRYYKRQRLGAVRVYWATILTGLFVGTAAYGFSSLGGDAESFDPITGLPGNLTTAVKINLLSLLEALFAFTLLLRFNELALFKRTKASLRNWYVMLALMLLAGLSMFAADPYGGFGTAAMLFVVAAVVAMVVNSFRLSWIVFLSFREKLVIIVFSFALLILLSLSLADTTTGLSFGTGTEPFGRVYSYPLNLFVTLAIMFGIIYSATSFLSLMFHLPTSSTIERKAGEISAMHSFSKLVGQALQPERLTATIVASTVEAETADASWLAVRDVRFGSLRPRVVAVHNIDAQLIERCIDVNALVEDADAKRQPLLLNQAAADHRMQIKPGDEIGSLLVVPLYAREENMGALFVTKEVAYGFESDDIETITAFASQAALALDNARLFVEQLEKERLAGELAIARNVQRKLLPQSVPEIDGLSIAASSVSAHEVGGDYYDFALAGEERLGIIVGDVSGKGTSAAFYMAELKGIFQSLSRLNLSPAEAMSHANEALSGSLEKNAFISATYGVLDLRREEFVFARAGHCPIAMISGKGESRYLRSKGLGLGLNRGPLFRSILEEERIELKAGDIFALYTDGLVESRNDAGEEYGYDRLIALLDDQRHLNALDLHALILKDLTTFTGQGHFSDDLTLVIIKWHGKGNTNIEALYKKPEALSKNDEKPERATTDIETRTEQTLG